MTSDSEVKWTKNGARASGRLGHAGLPDDEAADLATTTIAAIQGGFILARARRDADLLRAIGRQVAALVTATLRSVERPPAPPAPPAGATITS